MYKIFIKKIFIHERNVDIKNQYSILIRGEEISIFNIFYLSADRPMDKIFTE